MTTKKEKKLAPGWPALVAGDIVDIIAPGSRVADETVNACLVFLKNWNLVPRISSELFAEDVICANTDRARAAHLKKALMASDSKAVWCLRGGYGSIRLVPEILKWKKPRHTKLFIGLSDIVTLHLILNQNWGWPTLHGPLLDRLGLGKTPPAAQAELRALIFGETRQMEFTGLDPMNAAAKRKTKVSGPVTGGNLTVLGGHLGTALKWNTKNKIVFFEDLGERGYRIDRLLEQLRQAGAFNSCKAILFGDITGGDESDGTNKTWPVIERFAQGMKVPVLRGIQSGHDVLQRPVPFATPSLLALGDRATLVCASGSMLASKK